MFLRKKEREKTAEIVAQLVDLNKVGQKEGLLALEGIVINEESNYDPDLVRGISFVVDGIDPEDIQEMFWQKYMVRRLQGYDGLRYLLIMRGLKDIQKGTSIYFMQNDLCSMLPDEVEELYRKKKKDP